MPISFNGPSLTITLSSADTVVEVSEIYSRWKEWVLISDNAKYKPAFRQAGGDPLGGGVSAGVNTFIRNDLGWRIKPPEESIAINLIGNLYPEDPLVVWRAPTVGTFDTSINTNNAATALIVSTGGSGGSMTAADVWAYSVTGAMPAGSAGQKLKDTLTKLLFLSK